MAERVQKILSQWGIASRRQAEKMIVEGRVKLNGNLVNLGSKADPEQDLLEVDGVSLKPNSRPQSLYLLLHKPLGVVSTCQDPQKRITIIDLLPQKLTRGQGIHPVGRLDANSTGALLLTNDGKVTLALTHPRYHLPKTYHVCLRGNPPESILEKWRRGVILAGKTTLPAVIKVRQRFGNKTAIEIVLREGRNRQIRRVAEQLGFPVISLHRTAIGVIKLENLPSGHYRHLKNSEISFLQKQVTLAIGNSTAPIRKNHL